MEPEKWSSYSLGLMSVVFGILYGTAIGLFQRLSGVRLPVAVSGAGFAVLYLGLLRLTGRWGRT